VDPEKYPRLATHLRFVAGESPFYRQCGADPRELESFPILSKLMVRNSVGEMLTSKVESDRKALASELLRTSLSQEQNRAGELRFNGDVVIDQTTGTSGIPGRFPKTNSERAELALAGFMQRRSFDPDLKVGQFIPLLHHRWDQRFDFDIWSPAIEDVKRLYRWLAEKQARWIHIPAILIGRHAAALEKAGVADPVPTLKFLEATGSRLTPEAVEAARRVFHADTVNQYGTIEMWAIGYGLGTGPFEINSAAVHVELVDEEGHAIAASGVEGDVVVTSLVLRLLPLVRYRTGDRGSWVDGPGGGRLLALAEERDVNQLFIDGRRISGSEAFRPILRRVYSRVGYSGVTAVQISQIGAEKLRLTLNRSDQADEVCRVFAEECRKLRPGLEVEFDLRDSEDRSFPDRKGNLFVNRWGFPGERKSP
jgi:phenylacetate-CoA ligase